MVPENMDELNIDAYGLHPGDLIEIENRDSLFGFNDWAIYTARNTIIHLVKDGGGDIKQENLVHFVKNRRWRCNNTENQRNKPYTPDITIQRAIDMLNDNLSYDKKHSFIFSNSEHFAKFCKYGQKISRQKVDLFCKAASNKKLLCAFVLKLVAVADGDIPKFSPIIAEGLESIADRIEKYREKHQPVDSHEQWKSFDIRHFEN